MKRFWVFVIFLSIFISCTEINTSDPNDIYNYWFEENPPKDLDLLNGQYWQSAHWTKEYIMYLKLKPSKKWWDAFIEQNFLPIDSTTWTKPTDAPNWFQPSINSIKYGFNDEFDQGSRYFRDTITGVCYIYEIQL